MTKITEETAASTALVEATTTEVSLTAALHLDKHFASKAIITGDEPAVRWLTWLTGNNECFASNGRTALPSARGWFIDQPDEEAGLFPQDYELIEAMTTLCEQGKAAPCIVVHKDENDKPKKVLSWALPVASLFIVCEGVPSKDEMNNDPATRWGVAYAWPKGVNPKTGKRRTSQLHFVAFIKELMDAGYHGAFAVSFSSYLTDKILACLKAHEYVLKFADTLCRLAGKDEEVSYYAYALAIQCSLRTITAGTEPGQTKEIYYPIPVIPRLSRRRAQDQETSEDFLKSVAISEEQALILESGGRVERTVAWSIEKSKSILTGKPIASDFTEGEETPSTYTGVDVDGNEIVMDIPEDLR